MTRFGTVSLISGVLAAVALIGPLTFSQWGPFPNPDVAVRALGVGMWCGVGCVVLFVIGLFLFRLKGLWLAVPVVVALALPTWVIVTLGNELAACEKLPNHPMCVP